MGQRGATSRIRGHVHGIVCAALGGYRIEMMGLLTCYASVKLLERSEGGVLGLLVGCCWLCGRFWLFGSWFCFEGFEANRSHLFNPKEMSSRRTANLSPSSSAVPLGYAQYASSKKGRKGLHRRWYILAFVAAFVAYPAIMAWRVRQVQAKAKHEQASVVSSAFEPAPAKIRAAPPMVPVIQRTPSPTPAPKVYVLTHQKDVVVRGERNLLALGLRSPDWGFSIVISLSYFSISHCPPKPALFNTNIVLCILHSSQPQRKET